MVAQLPTQRHVTCDKGLGADRVGDSGKRGAEIIKPDLFMDSWFVLCKET